MPGFLLIDKPAGITSHDVIDVLRHVTGERRIGHAGTLDPFATGLLVVGVGREATRELGTFAGHNKEYLAMARLGATSDTQDRTGQVTPVGGIKLPAEAEVRAALEKFRGEIEQVPPMYSAKKIGGQKLYQLARKGKEIERQPVKIRIDEIELLSYVPPLLKFRVRCSAGTYVRTLAHDLGQTLGCGAYLEELRRTASGNFSVSDAIPLAELTKENWQEKLRRDGVTKRRSDEETGRAFVPRSPTSSLRHSVSINKKSGRGPAVENSTVGDAVRNYKSALR